MGQKKFDKAIYFEVATYENLRNKGNELIQLVDEILNMFMPYIKFPLKFDIEKINRRRKRYSNNVREINTVHKLLMNGDVQFFQLAPFETEDPDDESDEIISPYDNYVYPPFSLAFSCDYHEHYVNYLNRNLKKPIANIFSISISERMFNNFIPRDIQEKFVLLFQLAFMKLNGTTGFITFESIHAGPTPFPTRYEFQKSYSYEDFGIQFNHKLRGYYWGNVLSCDHIEALGGCEEIMQHAPCTTITEINNENGKSLYLQIAEDINDYSDDALKKLKSFLDPVLLQGANLIYKDPHGMRQEEINSGLVSRLVEDY